MKLSKNLVNIPLETTIKYPPLDNTDITTLDLTNSLNTLPLPDQLINSMTYLLQSSEAHHTNYALGEPQLRELLAQQSNKDFQKNNITPEHIALTSGVRNGIAVLLQAIINPLDEVIVFNPHWPTYINLIKIYGGIPKIVPLDEEDSFYPDFDLLEKACNSRTKVLILNNPQNPTGIIWDKNCISQLLNWANKKGIFVIADELFSDIIYDNNEFVSVASLSADFSNLAVVKAFSKSLSINGWRVGWIVTDPSLINHLQIILQATLGGVNTLCQKALVDAWDSTQEWISQSLNRHKERRDCLYNSLNKLHGFRAINPQAGLTIFANIQYYLGNEVGGQVPRSAVDFVNIVYKNTGVMISAGEEFGIEGYVRIAFCEDPSILEEAVLKIAKILEK